MSNDYVFCDICGKKQYEKDGPIISAGKLLCRSCWDDESSRLNDIPDVCRACGGPYPDCKTSCKLIDA